MATTLDAVPSSVAAYQVPTLPTQIHGHAMTMPDQVLMREKDFGVWREFTAAEVWDLVLDASTILDRKFSQKTSHDRPKNRHGAARKFCQRHSCSFPGNQLKSSSVV